VPVQPKKPKPGEVSGDALISLAVHLPALAQPLGAKAKAKVEPRKDAPKPRAPWHKVAWQLLKENGVQQ